VDLRLDDAVVIVTGGSSGVGLATAQRLLDEGARVAMCARDEQRLSARAAQLEATHPERVLAVPANVRERDEVERFVGVVVDRWGAIDGLVNNAGASRMSTFATTTEDDWRDELDLKFSSVLNPVRAVLDHLRRSDRAAVVNVNAILARQPEPKLVATSAARAGVLNLSRSLATELAPIRVNSVCLGLIDTGQWRRRYEETGTEQSYEAWSRELAEDRGVLLGRLGTADEVATVVVMLLSPVSSFVTGSAVDVGGGVGRYL
jgi:NAD(P)-dependent dehydrogenase (short-subunit alcohol dehydrogenase family)